jgi:hypothetical protein
VRVPVDDGAGDDGIGEGLIPVTEAAVAGEHDRAAVLAAAHHLENPTDLARPGHFS